MYMYVWRRKGGGEGGGGERTRNRLVQPAAQTYVTNLRQVDRLGGWIGGYMLCGWCSLFPDRLKDRHGHEHENNYGRHL